MMKSARVIGIVSSGLSWLTLATNAFAQTATGSASKGGTSGALPDSGTTGLTYLIFVGGVILFVFGTIKLILSYRN